MICGIDCWQGKAVFIELKLFDTTDHKVKFGGDIYDWMPTEYISTKELKRVDRFHPIRGGCRNRCDFDDSGLDFEKEDPFRCGVILGSGIGGSRRNRNSGGAAVYTKGQIEFPHLTIPKLMLNAAGGNISIKVRNAWDRTTRLPRLVRVRPMRSAMR